MYALAAGAARCVGVPPRAGGGSVAWGGIRAFGAGVGDLAGVVAPAPAGVSLPLWLSLSLPLGLSLSLPLGLSLSLSLGLSLSLPLGLSLSLPLGLSLWLGLLRLWLGLSLWLGLLRLWLGLALLLGLEPRPRPRRQNAPAASPPAEVALGATFASAG